MFSKILNAGFLPHNFLLLRHKLLEILGRDPILIYTMGKVGSTTVYHTFQQLFIWPLVYHVHHLTPEILEFMVSKYEKNELTVTGKISLRNLQRGSSRHLSASHILRKVYSEETNKKWNIVTLVRDPFSTYLSHIFQNPQISRKSLLDEKGKIDRKKVEGHVHKTFSGFNPNKDYISNWFDREFLKFTGVDLYQYPFNAEKGCTFISDEKFNIAVISLETLDENLPEVIREFVPGSNITSVEKKNVRNRDDQATFYNDLKKELAVPREGLEKMYSTKYAKHFFTKEFRIRKINKWSNG